MKEAFPTGDPVEPPDRELEKEPKLSAAEREAILALEKPMQKIIEQLWSEIESGNYSVILGEDASGRVPAIIMARTLKALSEERGLDAPALRFIAGSTNLKLEREKEQDRKKAVLGDHMTRVRDELLRVEEGVPEAKKMLVVTDSIDSGESISLLMKVLESNEIRADVATIAMIHPDKPIPGVHRKRNKLVYGMTLAPKIYDKRAVAGVYKNPRRLFARVAKRETPGESKDHATWLEQEKINEARELAFQVADRLIERYAGNRTEQM